MNANVVNIKIEWDKGDKGQTALRRKKFEVIEVIPYAETVIAKGMHLLIKFEDGVHKVVSTQSVTKLQ